ncbi:MAG: divergent PAP2 family protein [Treponema sp.]|nr:divergent PAP2 family protein [Treponema sp.]
MRVLPPPLRAFFENPMLLSAISSWFLAQLLKALIVLLKGHHRDGREILATMVWRTGGMPSSHAALVSSMTASVGFGQGIDSDLFVVVLFFALIIMRDAMGVRRSSGIQARSLNTMGRRLADEMGFEFHPVKEVHGHTPMEVIVGALLGIFIAAAYVFL